MDCICNINVYPCDSIREGTMVKDYPIAKSYLIIKNKRYGNTLTPTECIELLAKLINEEENISLSRQYKLINLNEYEVVEVD